MNADDFSVQEEHAHAVPGPSRGALLPQRTLPLRRSVRAAVVLL